jgi:hypothetical protein
VTDAIRTPDELLSGLPEFPFEPVYHGYDALRLAYLDEGDGDPVVFFHGEPTWSFLWRRVILAVRDGGYRCIAPDLPGFGRSDKPTDLSWYGYGRPQRRRGDPAGRERRPGRHDRRARLGADRSDCASRPSIPIASGASSSSIPACSPGRTPRPDPRRAGRETGHYFPFHAQPSALGGLLLWFRLCDGDL